MVFTRTKRTAQKVADELAERGFKIGAVHGDLQPGGAREGAAKFRDGELDVLVATDVAARGIDIDDVTHVINYRSPRTSRPTCTASAAPAAPARPAIAITLVDWDDLTRWKMIDKVLDLPFEEPVETYSTSEHFFHDQGIVPGTKGRLVPEKPAEERKPREERADRPRRDRNRTRTRGGKPAQGDGASSGTASTASDTAETATGEGTSKPRRNRNRRRSRGGSSAAAASSSE